MKLMTKEEQKQKNGGYYWHCHKCRIKVNGALTHNRRAYSRTAAQNAGRDHAQKHSGGVNFWNLGLIEGCPNV